MTIRHTYISFWILALLLGVTCGKLIHTFAKQGPLDSGDPPVGTASPAPLSFSPISSSARYLWQETAGLRDNDAFPDEVERIYRESKSPLRARSLLNFRIQNSNFEEWEALIAAGKVERIEFLRELGEHLARTDPQRATRLFFRRQYRFENLDQVYAFRDPLIRTAADIDPEMVLEELKAMRRGGSQMDNSLFFSGHWARSDPRAAAGNFADLVSLRNMRMDGSPEMPDKAFAEIIAKSWLQKAPEEVVEYVGALPDGPTREALQAALNELAPAE